MLSTLLLCGAFLAADPSARAAEDAHSKADTLAAYQQARAKIGRDADAQVRLALWCEQHGLSSERLKHLAMAILTDPTHTSARGLLGLMAFRGRWQLPQEIRETLQADETKSAALADYQSRRARIDNTAAAHWKIASWCEQHGLKPEANAHLAAVTQLDPGRDAAWRRLGYKKQGSRWIAEDQLAKQRADADARTRADKHWTAVLTRLRTGLENASKRDKTVVALADLTDPGAVPAICATFATGKTAHQKLAVQLLGQIDSSDATRALAVLSVASDSGDVRGIAIETLRHRHPHDVAALLVELLRDPLLDRDPILYHYAVQPTGLGAVGSPGFVYVKGPMYDIFRTYTVDEVFRSPQANAPAMANYTDRVMAQRQNQFKDLRRIILRVLTESASAVEAAEMHVRAVDELNGRIIRALSAVNRQSPGRDPEAWRKWWQEEQGYAYVPPPPATRQDLTLSDDKPTFVINVHYSCFAAGTPVHTLTGLRPIESLQIGDQVLTQDARTAELSYQPVLAAVHNKPDNLMEINLGPEVIRATGIHRFWKAGKGWVAARDLQAGDNLRALGGVAEVKSIKRGPVEPVYNLKVMQAQSFFVGERGMLVHDNSPVEPVAQPFDAIPGAFSDQ